MNLFVGYSSFIFIDVHICRLHFFFQLTLILRIAYSDIFYRHVLLNTMQFIDFFLF
jgi:hypothetical protein